MTCPECVIFPMSHIQNIFNRIQKQPALADFFSVVWMFVFGTQLWHHAHNQVSVLDEGLYLYKGWLFSTGKYIPFQAYGPWTNQMPLAFLIPGWVEQLFGTGLQTGRMLAVALGMLMLPGLWLTARRLGGRWTAMLIMVLAAVNPAAIRMISTATSQGLIACILIWTMWFSLGADRKSWQLAIGGMLAGCIVMIRINLLPLLPLLLFYILWMHGWKKACWSLAGMLVIFAGLHVYYWPNILQIWAKWLPLGFLRPWFAPKTIPTWKPDNPFAFRLASFFMAYRYHFAALAGSMVAWVLWPGKEKMVAEKYKTAIFLTVLLVVLILLHAWAALGNEYCVFCFPTYSAFYAGLGLLLVSATIPSWNLNPPTWRKWLGSLLFVTLLAGMAYSAEQAFEIMFGELAYKRLLSLPLPGMNGAQIWQVLANKFQLEYKSIYDTVHVVLPITLSVLIGVMIIILPVLVSFILNGWQKNFRTSWGTGMLSLFIVVGLAAPLPAIAGDYKSYDCSENVIPSYETAGKQISKYIPAGAKVYWAGYSPVTLLYLPQAEIYPSQLHGRYSYRISTDDNALLKYGWWNEHLAGLWLSEADYVLADQRNLGKDDFLYERLDQYELVVQTSAQNCQSDSALFLYRRK